MGEQPLKAKKKKWQSLRKLKNGVKNNQYVNNQR